MCIEEQHKDNEARNNNMLRPGIYEQLIDRRLAQELDHLPENQKATAAIDQAEASSVLSAGSGGAGQSAGCHDRRSGGRGYRRYYSG